MDHGNDESRLRPIDWCLIGLFLVIVGGVFVTRSTLSAATVPLFNDTDDAMRLVTIRDLMAGQNWFDIVQHRLNTPFGAEMHWSRLIDLPIAALILLLRPVFGANAEIAVAYAWPLGLLLALLWLYARLTLKLVGRDGLLPALALPAFSLITMAEFAPGRLDHHSVQILLLLGTLLLAIGALERPRLAIGAGIAAATALAIGIESLPGIVSAVLAFGLIWVFVPARAAALRWFGLSFGLASLAHLAIVLPPSRWLIASCDFISVVYVVAALGTAIGFVTLSLLPLASRPWLMRLVVGGVVGGSLVAVIAIAFPGCLRGPYSNLDPWLITNWIDRISEAQPFWVSFADDPTYASAVGVPPLLALLAVAWRVSRGPAEGRGKWLVYGLFLLVALVVTLLQIRVARMATSLAVPGGALLIVEARRLYLARRRLLPLLGLVFGWFGAAGLAVAVLVNIGIMLFPEYEKSLDDPEAGSRTACRLPAAFTDLAALPATRLMAPIDLGAHLLLFTPHQVVAAPYHRNVEGVRDTFAFFNQPADVARDILERRGVTLVVICPAMPEVRGAKDRAPDSFASLYREGKLPDWLVEQGPPDAVLRLYRVMPRS